MGESEQHARSSFYCEKKEEISVHPILLNSAEWVGNSGDLQTWGKVCLLFIINWVTNY